MQLSLIGGGNKMGWSNNPATRARPATDAEKLAILQEKFSHEQEVMQRQINELVEALFVKYQENPDSETKKLLIIHLGSEFFKRTKA